MPGAPMPPDSSAREIKYRRGRPAVSSARKLQLVARKLLGVAQVQTTVSDHGMVPGLSGEGLEAAEFRVLFGVGGQKHGLSALCCDDEEPGVGHEQHLSIAVAPLLPAALA